MRLVVISPHLDDAVLFAGGGMTIARSLGIEVLILTVFTADVPTHQPSDYARAFHRQCGLDDHDAVTARRAEDKRACAVLDVDCRWLNLLDALYRASPTGPLYDRDAALFGPPLDPDALGVLVLDLLAEHLRPDDVALLPLSVGHHVDHVPVRRWGEAAARLAGARPILRRIALRRPTWQPRLDRSEHRRSGEAASHAFPAHAHPQATRGRRVRPMPGRWCCSGERAGSLVIFRLVYGA